LLDGHAQHGQRMEAAALVHRGAARFHDPVQNRSRLRFGLQDGTPPVALRADR